MQAPRIHDHECSACLTISTQTISEAAAIGGGDSGNFERVWNTALEMYTILRSDACQLDDILVCLSLSGVSIRRAFWATS